MKSANHPLLPAMARAFRRAAWLGLALSGTVMAATTDLSNAPLFTSSATAVKPNIMFILDDSGSMKSDYLPDEAGRFSSTTYGRKSVQCNGVAYDPDTVYSLPVDYTGAPVAAASLSFITPDATTQTNPQRSLGASISSVPSVGDILTVAPQGYNPGSSWYTQGDTVTVFTSSTNYFVATVTRWDRYTPALQIKVTYVAPGAAPMTSPKIGDGEPNTAVYYTYNKSIGTQPRMGYTYDSSGNVSTTSPFYRECISQVGSTPGSNVFNAVTVTAASTEAQNYANWYVYYRTRMTMMKSSISLAFQSIDSRYRLGFSTISAELAAENTSFLNVRTVDATQKQKFYAAVNAAQPIVYTPLRGALAKAGQYFANKAPSQTYDPIQYSCQRNFTILSTDGYWNVNDEINSGSPRYGAYKLDNLTLVGQQDGSGTLRPMLDGQTLSKTTTQTWTVTAVTTVTKTWPRTATSVTSKSTTTVAPVQGFEQLSYSLVGKVTTISGMDRPAKNCGSSCWVTVNSSGHGLSSGDKIVISGGSDSDYRGTFSGSSMEVLSANSYRYKVTTGRPDNNASGNYTVTPDVSSSCSSGQSMAVQSRTTRDSTSTTIFTQSTTTVTISTVSQVVTTTDITPYSRVTTEQNGVQTSDTGDVAGAVKSTPVNGATTVTAGTPVTTPSTSTTPATTGYSAWTSPTTTNLGCRTSAPATVTNNIAATTTTSETSSGPTTTSNTSDGAVVSIPTDSTSTSTAKVTVFNTDSRGGVSNTLADVAMYYYNTDLRNNSLSNCTGSEGTDVCKDNVPGDSADAAHSYGDVARWQHMTTFTLGLGLNGLLKYDVNYLTQKSGDFFDITNNNKNWPAAGDGQTAENIDDLWHAAVNGRGQYFSAGNPASLSRSLNDALDSIKKITGAASAASTSSLQPVEGDNDIYVAQFTTAEWVGDVLSFKIDPTTGGISNTVTWSAQARLDGLAPASRKIYYKQPSSATLRDFTYANLSTDGYNGLFDGFCGKTGAGGGTAPAQCPTLGTTAKDAANLGTNLVSFLKGDKSLTYYRTRTHLLGDVINASPLFIGKPAFKYTENGYGAWAAGKSGRTAVVLAAANDGMVHAFSRDTGDELWAYIPTAVMKNLYKLADTGYANNHSYYVDGSPQVGDVYGDDGTGVDWHTIVVGGLNAGGRSYYALDVTNPATPKVLWEFSNNDLGYTYGNPIITKRTDGTWVVVIASGYNNVVPGDGNGHLFVLDAIKGTLITQIKTFSTGSTPVGDTTTPSGLAKINSWVDSEALNTSQRFYGGDMLGNVWRFDLDNLVEPKGKALRLAQLTAPDGTAQPITVKPAVAEVVYNSAKYPVVYVPTGRYLGTSDLADTTVQSVYAIKDPLADLPYGVVRSNANFVTQTLADTGNAARTGTSKTVDWSTKSGWYVDLPGSGERVSVNPQLALETLYVGTNKPNNDACTVGGDSFLYQFNIANGSSTSSYVGNVLIQGLTLVQLTTGSADGSVVTIITRSDGTLQTQVSAPPTSSINLRRTSWRELVE